MSRLKSKLAFFRPPPDIDHSKLVSGQVSRRGGILQSAPRNRVYSRLMLIFKIAATVLGLLLVVRTLNNPQELALRVRSINPWIFSTAVLLMVLQIALVTLRWRLIAHAVSETRSQLPS